MVPSGTPIGPEKTVGPVRRCDQRSNRSRRERNNGVLNVGVRMPVERDYSAPANAMVLSSAFASCRESSLVCCTTIGTSESIVLA